MWTPEVPVYFFTGGLAGASAGLAFVARLTGNRKLARAASANAFAGMAVSPVLLISDLGVRRRFLNMLRVFKTTSPMSVGSWLLTVEGGLVTVVAAHEFLGVFPRPLARVAQAVAGVLGMPLATYTAALVANTAVPAWHEGRRELPFAFAGGSAMAAGGLAVLMVPGPAGAPARRLAMVGAVGEALAMQLLTRRLGKLSEAYTTGPAGALRRATMATAGGGGVALAVAEVRRGRALGRIGALLALAGSMLGRWTVFRAGFQSALDAEQTVEPQLEHAVTHTR